MRITIGLRHHPFTHVPGTFVVLPGSTLQLQIFPTLIKVAGHEEIPLTLEGPIEKFTIINNGINNILDIIRFIRVFGNYLIQ